MGQNNLFWTIAIFSYSVMIYLLNLYVCNTSDDSRIKVAVAFIVSGFDVPKKSAIVVEKELRICLLLLHFFDVKLYNCCLIDLFDLLFMILSYFSKHSLQSSLGISSYVFSL